MRLSKFLMVLVVAWSVPLLAAETKPVVEAAPDKAAVLAALKAQKPEPGFRVLLAVPEIADGGAPFHVKIVSTIPTTDWIGLFDPKAPDPVASQFITKFNGESVLETDLKLQKTTRLRAVVRAGGKFYEVFKEVKIALTDCHD